MMRINTKLTVSLAAALLIAVVFCGCRTDTETEYVAVTDKIAPENASDFAATEQGNGILLSWQDSVSEDVNFYKITWNQPLPISAARTAESQAEQALYVPAGEQYFFVYNLTEGIEYEFELKAVDFAGNASSGIKTALVMGNSNKNPVTHFSASYENGEMNLFWENPDDELFSGSILKITYINSGVTETLSFDSSVHSFAWKNGENGKGYDFGICTVNSLNQKSRTENLAINYFPYNLTNPIVEITTPKNQEITSKEVWIENASFSVKGTENSAWNSEDISTSIRGRGNSTWAQPKKPYALKLDKKQELMGFPKHKRWVLIANYLDNSFMRNCMAFYLSSCLEMDYTLRGDFVNLVLNGQYKGLYWLGEAIKVDKKRVNIDEDDDYLIELDVYYDETWKFKSAIRAMPYMISNDDSMSDERLSNLSGKIEQLEKLLYPDFTEGMNTNDCSAPDESYTEKLDITSWAKFWIINELMSNNELKHPKSCYFTFENSTGILKAGPVWDFDWASLSQSSSCTLKDTIYYNALFKSPAFRGKVKELWAAYYNSIDIDSQIEKLRAQIYSDQQNDALVWEAHTDPSTIVREDFDAYADFLKETLNKKFQVVNAEIDGL